MKLEAIHNMLMLMQQHAQDPEVATILAPARLQIEDLILRDLPTLTEQELAIKDKSKKVVAYQSRTDCSIHLAHIVVNNAYRKSNTRLARV